jgi:hypothetical protein
VTFGGWTAAQIVAALETGQRPDGRELAPIIPTTFVMKMVPPEAPPAPR